MLDNYEPNTQIQPHLEGGTEWELTNCDVPYICEIVKFNPHPSPHLALEGGSGA